MTISRTICLGFLSVITIGSLLLTFPFSIATGEWGNFVTALFTTTSAVCVTGLAVVDTGTYFSFWGQFILTCLIQIGGLGYMTTTTFLILLIGKKFDFHQKVAIQESFDRPFLQGSKSLINSIIATTLIFEIFGAILMFKVFIQQYPPLQSLWLAIFHSVSAWNNAGFSLFKDNLMSYQNSFVINFAITMLIIFGGIGYQVIIEFYFWLNSIFISKNKQRFSFSLNFKVVVSTTIFLLVFGTISFYLTELHNPNTLQGLNIKGKILAAWFQSVTTRTAGFNSIDIGRMTTAGLFLSMGLMFIGASPSGTGGGIKTTTLRILINGTKSVLQGKESVIMYQREVPASLILKSMAVVFGSSLTVILMTFIITIVQPSLDFIAIFFEVISAFGTVGLSMGITPSLNLVPELIIILTMYIGRVGVLLLMSAVIGDIPPSRIKYPEENLLIG